MKHNGRRLPDDIFREKANRVTSDWSEPSRRTPSTFKDRWARGLIQPLRPEPQVKLRKLGELKEPGQTCENGHFLYPLELEQGCQQCLHLTRSVPKVPKQRPAPTVPVWKRLRIKFSVWQALPAGEKLALWSQLNSTRSK